MTLQSVRWSSMRKITKQLKTEVTSKRKTGERIIFALVSSRGGRRAFSIKDDRSLSTQC